VLVLFSQLIANDGRAEIVETEFDCADAAIFIHRLLFWPRDELTIHFIDVRPESSGWQGEQNRGRSFTRYCAEHGPGCPAPPSYTG